MSSFAPIGETLHKWSVENRVHIATEYKDCEVRSFEVATQFGSVQVWVDPQADGRFEVLG